jgi:hypothetical protein
MSTKTLGGKMAARKKEQQTFGEYLGDVKDIQPVIESLININKFKNRIAEVQAGPYTVDAHFTPDGKFLYLKLEPRH